MKISRLYLILFLLVAVQACSQPAKLIDKKTEKLFEKAKTAYQQRNDEEAMTWVVKTIQRSPDYPDAHMLKFQLHQDSKQFDEAKLELEKVIKISPNFFPNAHLFLGRIYLSEGNYQKSIERLEYFRKYRDADSKLLNEASSHLATCYFATEAIKHPVPFDPISLGSAINSSNSEYFPTLTANDQTMLFTRRVKVENSSLEQEDFYISVKENDQWQMAKALKYINTSGNEGAPSIAPNGELIVFTACENVYGEYGGGKKGLGSCDLFYSFRVGNQWSKPRNMGPNINSRNWETQPSISADGRTLYFVRANKKKRGINNLDIYTSILNKEGEWTLATKLSEVVNTPRDESSVLIHPDGRTLYFTSDGHLGMGGEDIFVSRKDENGKWGMPVNLGYPINTHNNENSLVVTASGEIAYFSSDRKGGLGGLDLYQFELYPEIRPTRVNYMQGFVFDEVSKKPIQAFFELIDIKTGKTVVESYSNTVDGNFLVTVPTDRDYALNVSAPDYLFYSANFTAKEGSAAKPFLVDVPLSKLSSGVSIVLENIFFDTDQYEPKSESDIEIKKIHSLLNNNPTLRIELSGHTDNVGSEAHNKELSLKRAQSVMNSLLEYGIDKSRIEVKGFGSEKPITDNSAESGRAKNRRTEMKIL